jgi:hypothetical protein
MRCYDNNSNRNQRVIARQMLLRMPVATIRRIEEHGRRRIWPGKRRRAHSAEGRENDDRKQNGPDAHRSISQPGAPPLTNETAKVS